MIGFFNPTVHQKTKFMRRFLFLFLSWIALNSQAQTDSLQTILTLQEYLGFVKQYHPIVRQANLIINESEAKLLKARGAFDPKIDIDYDQKKFKNTEYFDKLNATFKVPTWYGIEFKANFEQNEGAFLNPEADVPADGLYSVGVSLSLARNFLINERMAMLRQAKLFTRQARADRQLVINEILFNASVTYFNWLRRYNEKLVYESFLKNAEFRFNGVKRSFSEGQLAAIDTLESGIIVTNRKLNLENSRIKFVKATLELSNFLWLNNDTPLELQDNVVPDTGTLVGIDDVLQVLDFSMDSLQINEHPKMISLDLKYQQLDVDRKLKANKLLPQIDLQYNFLTENPELINSFTQSQFKGALRVNFPLFLRKERGDLKLAKLKLQDVDFERTATRISLQNKIDGISQEIESFQLQSQFTISMVNDYFRLLRAEERKFALGESSIFLVNSRESKLIDSRLKAIELENKLFLSKANLVNVLALIN